MALTLLGREKRAVLCWNLDHVRVNKFRRISFQKGQQMGDQNISVVWEEIFEKVHLAKEKMERHGYSFSSVGRDF